jgi:serine/threonine-protein kinase PknG
MNACIATPGCTGEVVDGFCSVCGAQPRRGMLVNLVDVSPVPAGDPATAILRNPEVPEHKRFCSVCGDPVGRGHGGRPGRTEGFCPKDGAPYSFVPKLSVGELVGGQYEVLGCLAHGWQSWIYLARDRNVSDRWVVLKGLLDSGDADAMQTAVAEKAFLAEVDHPNIVKIYNFVQHPDARTGGQDGYIVMEYVGGRALKDMLVELRRSDDQASLPLEHVLAYGLEVLRALDYLHSLGLLYCDFKPDNVIQSEGQLKLIYLGGVRRAADDGSPIFGTVGYQAPEVATEGPSVSSDLYTVGRALAVMSFPFRGYTTTHVDSLPPRSDVPLLRRYESFDRLLRRATHRDPARRFQSAEEMAEQLTGVLREVLSARDGQPRPAASTLFGPEQFTAGADVAKDDPGGAVLPPLGPAVAAAALPVPLPHKSDPRAAGFLAGLAGLTARDPESLVEALTSIPVASPEVSLMLVRAWIGVGELVAADALLDELDEILTGDWRVDWYRGLGALAQGRADKAADWFEELYDLLPGETAPKLALAFASELQGDREAAARYHEMVWRTDPTYVSAAFGLARVRLAGGDRAGAVTALDSVPTSSGRYVAALLAADDADVHGLTRPDLTEPSQPLQDIPPSIPGRLRSASALGKLANSLWNRRYGTPVFVVLAVGALALSVLDARPHRAVTLVGGFAAVLLAVILIIVVYRWRDASSSRLYGPGPAELEAGSRSAQARWLIERGRVAEAEPILRQLVEKRSRADPRAVTASANLAVALRGLGRPDEARRLYDRLPWSELTNPTDSLLLRANFAAILHDLGETERAAELLRDALNQSETALGPAHPGVISARGDHAVALRTLGRLDEAEAEARTALDAANRHLPTESQEIPRLKANLAAIRRERGALDEAEDLLRSALTDASDTLGPAHPQTSTIRADLAAVLHDRGHRDEAMGLLHQVIADRSRHLGEGQPTTLEARTSLAFARLSAGDADGAEDDFTTLLAYAVDNGGTADLQRIVDLANTGLTMARGGGA